MAALPSGTVTFLFTDIEASTRRWESDASAMDVALTRHDRVLREAVEARGGCVVKSTGDGMLAVFDRATAALAAAVDAQVALLDVDLLARMAVHTGEAFERDGDYFGPALNRAARLVAIGHGGQVLVSQATERLAGDFELRDLGEHRLRDLSRPERVFQVVAEGLVVGFPPLRSVDARPGNLPTQVTSFVGRADAVVGVSEWVREHRLVTLTGVGGVGKTRLAVQVAAEVLGEFGDGAWLCELASASDADAFVEVVAATFDVRTRPDMSLRDAAVELLRRRRVLLVLDNCEHLLAEVAEFVEVVLRVCASVHVLVTSREVLSIDGERVWGVRSIADQDAINLFVDRARAVRADFAVDDATLAVVGEICARVDGIPLGIELAAARVLALQPGEIAARLDQRFRLLGGTRRGGVERHQTLRAMVEWSYALLSDPERFVFDRLAVFTGSFDATAAAAVTAEPDAEVWDVLDSLVRKSMLVTEARNGGETRYRMLETLRQYGREQLGARGELDRRRRAHAAYYATLAERCGAEAYTEREVEARQFALMALDNTRAAVNWSLDAERAEDGLYAMRIIASLATFVTTARSSGLGEWAERATPRLDGVDPALRVAVLGAAAFSAINRGDPDAASAYARRGIADGMPIGCPAPTLAPAVMAAMNLLAGDWADAVRLLHESARELDAIGHSWGVISLELVAVIFSAFGGDTQTAQAEAERLLPLARKTRNPTNLVIALYAYAVAWWREKPQPALQALDESLTLTERGASDVVYPEAQQLVARIRHALNDRRGGLAAVLTGQAYAHRIGNRPLAIAFLWWGIELLAGYHAYEYAAVCIGVTEQGPLAANLASAVGEYALEHDHAKNATRSGLGEDRYNELLRYGGSMTYDDVIDYTQRELSQLLADDQT